MKRYTKYLAEKQLKVSRCLLTGINQMMRQMQLPPVTRRVQDFMAEAEMLSQYFTELTNLRRQSAEVECLLHLQTCENGKMCQIDQKVRSLFRNDRSISMNSLFVRQTIELTCFL